MLPDVGLRITSPHHVRPSVRSGEYGAPATKAVVPQRLACRPHPARLSGSRQAISPRRDVGGRRAARTVARPGAADVVVGRDPRAATDALPSRPRCQIGDRRTRSRRTRSRPRRPPESVLHSPGSARHPSLGIVRYSSGARASRGRPSRRQPTGTVTRQRPSPAGTDAVCTALRGGGVTVGGIADVVDVMVRRPWVTLARPSPSGSAMGRGLQPLPSMKPSTAPCQQRPR